MEYAELSQLWSSANNPEIEISLNKKAMTELTAQKLKSSMSEIKWNAVIEIIVTFIWFIYLVNFSIEYYQITPFLVSGVLLMGLAILSIIMEIRKLSLYNLIDHNFSVFQAQKRIEKLKLLENLDINLLYFLIPTFFVPFALVIAKGFFNIDILQLGFSGIDIALAIVGSIIVAVIMVGVLRRDQFKNINESLEFLKEINQKEDPEGSNL